MAEQPLEDIIEAYALGTLSQAEARAFEARLANSAGLRRAVAEAQAVVDLLADSAPQLAPSPQLRDRVLGMAQADVEGYALGILTASEAHEIEARQATSDMLRQSMREARAVVGLLAASPTEVAPSSALRERLLATVAAERAGQTPAVRSVGTARRMPVPLRPSASARPAAVAPTLLRAPRWTTWLAAASFLLAVGLGGWNAALQQQVNRQAAQLAQDRQALSALPGADRFWTMRGEPLLAPQAVSTLALNLSQKQTVLVVRGFPPLAPDKTYQVWVVLAGRQVPIGSFAPPTTSSDSTLVVPSDLSGVTHAMITIEPASGSARPTGPVVMGGDL